MFRPFWCCFRCFGWCLRVCMAVGISKLCAKSSSVTKHENSNILRCTPCASVTAQGTRSQNSALATALWVCKVHRKCSACKDAVLPAKQLNARHWQDASGCRKHCSHDDSIHYNVSYAASAALRCVLVPSTPNAANQIVPICALYHDCDNTEFKLEQSKPCRPCHHSRDDRSKHALQAI